MPKRKRSSVGHRRPKKKKVEQGVAVEEESDDLEEEEEPENPASTPPPQPEDAPPQPPHTHAAAVPEPLFRSPLEILEEERDAACHKAVVVIRRWLKTVDTHFNDDGEFLWRDRSVVLRNLKRLREMDAERDAAEDYADFKQKEVAAYKSVRILRRLARRFPRNASYARQADLAQKRLTNLRRAYRDGEHRCADRRPRRDATVEDQIGILMLQVGLAEAIQWVHTRDLRENLYSDAPRETVAEQRARGTRHAREHFRTLVHARLEKEKEDPSLRDSRKDMLSWSGSDLVDTRECIFDALREMGECLCPRQSRQSCEMCRAEGESSGQPGTSSG